MAVLLDFSRFRPGYEVISPSTGIPYKLGKPLAKDILFHVDDGPNNCCVKLLEPVSGAEEVRLQRRAHSCGVPTPAVVDWTVQDGCGFLLMELMADSYCIYDFYGDASEEWSWFASQPARKGEAVPDAVTVAHLITRLNDAGMLFPDRTPFNFMVHNDGHLVVIDYGHAEQWRGGEGAAAAAAGADAGAAPEPEWIPVPPERRDPLEWNREMR